MRRQALSIRMEFRALRLAMRSLDRSLRRLASNERLGPSTGERRQKLRLSSKRRAAIVLQGRYMGYMRQLKPRQKANVRQVKQEKGIKAAISSARSIIKS